MFGAALERKNRVVEMKKKSNKIGNDEMEL